MAAPSRWGPDDERGALNLADGEPLARAARLVRAGRVYPLGLPIRHNHGPTTPARPFTVHVPFDRSSGTISAADDYVVLNTHGTTHVDSLSHLWQGETVYNGHPARSGKCAIDTMGWIAGRGVLLDVAALRGRPLRPGEEIQPDELSAAEANAAPVGRGDIVLVRTAYLESGDWDSTDFNREWPGLAVSCADWLLEREVAAVGCDNHGVEARPQTSATPLELHLSLLWKSGVPLMEYVWLAGLARDRIAEFLFVAAPLRIVGGSGSPISPLAIV
jgi:kynurenine formamidase